jgi:hypothetical protein
LLGSVVAGVIVLVVTYQAVTENIARARTELAAQVAGSEGYPTLGELANMSDDELRRQDLALVNLRCAEDLPGSKKDRHTEVFGDSQQMVAAGESRNGTSFVLRA